MALSQDNSISGDEVGTTIVHSTKTGIVEYRDNNPFADGVSGLCYLPNGSGLVACGYSYNGGNFNLELVHSFGHSTLLTCVALSQDNSVSGDEVGTIIVHSTKTGIVEFRADNVFAGGVLGLCYLPNGSGLVACGDDGKVIIWSESGGGW